MRHIEMDTARRLVTRGTLSLTVFSVIAVCAHAQQSTQTAPVSTTVTVVGSPEPVTLGESDRSTVVIDTGSTL